MTLEKYGARAALTALAVGLAGDLLLRAVPWGINVFLWLMLVAAWVIFEGRTTGRRLKPQSYALISAALLCGIGFAWRDSPWLQFANVVGCFGAVTLAAVHEAGYGMHRTTFIELVRGVLGAAFGSRRAPQFVISQLGMWAGYARKELSDAEEGVARSNFVLPSIVRGIILSLLPLLVFGALFMSADATYERYVRNVIEIDPATLFSHIALWVVYTLLAVAALLLLFGESAKLEKLRLHPSGPVTIELLIVLGVIVAVFASFVAVQVPYLFGGAERIETEEGLTYAEYARRGFFELAFATALVLPILLVCDEWLACVSARVRFIFRMMASAQLVLVAVVVASALHRMRLYVDAYGLTEDRYFVTAFIWLMVAVLAWFGVTLWFHARERFVAGAVVLGFAGLFLLHAINPEARVAETNVDRFRAGQGFDAYHASRMSADAVPVLAGVLEELEPEERATLFGHWWRTWSADADADWRTWSWGRSRARAVVRGLGAAE